MKKGNWCDDCMDLNNKLGDMIGEMPLPHYANCGECKAGSHWLPKENANSGYPLLADVGERPLPCPFCGSEARLVYCEPECCDKLRWVECSNDSCGVTMWTDKATDWNKRANVS